MTSTARALVIAVGLGVLAAGCTARQPVTASPARASSPGTSGHGAAVAVAPNGPYLVIERAAIVPTGVCEALRKLLHLVRERRQEPGAHALQRS